MPSSPSRPHFAVYKDQYWYTFASAVKIVEILSRRKLCVSALLTSVTSTVGWYPASRYSHCLLNQVLVWFDNTMEEYMQEITMLLLVQEWP